MPSLASQLLLVVTFPLANMYTLGAALLGLLVVTSILLRRSYRYFGRRSSKQGEALVRIPRPHTSLRTGTNLDSPEEIARFEVQLQETMRTISAQLDSKMIALQQLIRLANETLARLELTQSDLPAQSDDENEDRASVARAERVAGESSEASADPRSAQILSLADEGYSAATIAHRVAASVLEVETILRERSQH